MATAVLSITARAKRKEAEKKKDDKQPEKMDVDDDTKKDAGQEKDKKEAEKDEKEKVRRSEGVGNLPPVRSAFSISPGHRSRFRDMTGW